jgi:hypothetical protein
MATKKKTEQKSPANPAKVVYKNDAKKKAKDKGNSDLAGLKGKGLKQLSVAERAVYDEAVGMKLGLLDENGRVIG